MDHETKNMTISIDVLDDASPENVSYISGLSTDDRNEDFDEIEEEHYRIKYGSPSYSEGTVSSHPQIEQLDSNDICDRLYRAGQKKEKRRAMGIRAKLDQENQVETPKLRLAAERSYTPMRTRPNIENVHDHLYSLSKKKQSDQIKKKQEEMEALESKLKGAILSPEQGREVAGRLYQRSKVKNQEGKKLRKEIEQKLAPRSPTPTKKIPLSKAGDMYHRALLQKAQKERKIESILNQPRESSFPKMRTQSRSRASSRSRSSSRPRATSRSRNSSRSPKNSIRARSPRRSSRTPSRRESAGSRTTTPSKRKTNENLETINKPFANQRAKNKLPPVPIKTRVQSPDLRTSIQTSY